MASGKATPEAPDEVWPRPGHKRREEMGHGGPCCLLGNDQCGSACPRCGSSGEDVALSGQVGTSMLGRWAWAYLPSWVVLPQGISWAKPGSLSPGSPRPKGARPQRDLVGVCLLS